MLLPKLPVNTQTMVWGFFHHYKGTLYRLTLLLQGDSWPELLGVLFQASQSTEPGLREASFRIFTTTPSIIEKQHEDAVLNVFSKGFKDDHIAVCISTYCQSYRTAC